MATYDEILERMNDKFLELSGFEADKVSDIGIRLRILAGEIFSLNSDIDWIKKQMFPNTASGQQLDLHANQRGLSRKMGNKAMGIIMFKLDTPLEYDIVIPKGTICTTSDGTLNFITSELSSIESGSNYAMVNAQAEKSGTQYNVSPKEISTIVTYFSVGISILNSSAFINGTDDETDEQLRKRIMLSLQNISNGANKDYYISLAKSVDGIQSASVIPQSKGIGTLSVFLGGRGDTASDTAYQNADQLIQNNKSIGIDVTVAKATPKSISVSVKISPKADYTFDNVQTSVKNSITEFFNNMSVGETFTISALGSAIFGSEGLQNYAFDNMTDVEVSQREIAVMSTVTISQITT